MQAFADRTLSWAAALALFAVAGWLCVRVPDWSPWIRVGGGIFIFGSREEGSAEPPHEVKLAAFSIGRTELTCGEFAEFRTTTAPDPRRPVSAVSYDDALAYCAWLSEKLGRRVRLPTEAEWEFAARGGVLGARYPWGWGAPEGRACFASDSVRRVASFAANPVGLHDMAGNVAEWCQAEGDAARAPVRGGSWADRAPKFLRVFQHVMLPREYRDADVGFRVAVENVER
ncbi:MAG: SUMF1/EgtB/PvdO family nonheme iron enzyme [bacterium]